MRRRRAVAPVAFILVAGLSSAALAQDLGPACGRLEAPGDGYRAAGTCAFNVGYGPLRLASQSPFQSLRIGLLPRSPSTLAAGRVEWRTSATWSNIWALNEGDYLLDYEMLQESVAVAYGLTDSVQIELDVIDRNRFGGAMDGFIQGFHDLFGIDQGGRDEVPRGDFRIQVEGGADEPPILLSNGDRGSFSRSLALSVQQNLTCGTEDFPALAAEATVRTELSEPDDLQGGGPVDLETSASLAKRFGDLYAYLGVGLAWFGKEEARGIELRTTQFSALVAVEWRFSARMSVIVQYLLSQGVARDFGTYSDPSHEVTIGWKGEIGAGAVLEIGLIENVIAHDNSPDFGVHVGLAIRI